LCLARLDALQVGKLDAISRQENFPIAAIAQSLVGRQLGIHEGDDLACIALHARRSLGEKPSVDKPA
jgi:hypothetical protein